MGKISIPAKVVKSSNPVKLTNEVADTINDERIVEKIKENEGLFMEDNPTDKAVKVISYQKFLGIPDDKYSISYLTKAVELLKSKNLTNKEIATELKTALYKVGGRDIHKAYVYLRLDNTIKSLVSKQKKL